MKFSAAHRVMFIPMLVLLFLATGITISGAETPPPLPTAEKRARFIASHHAGLDPSGWARGHRAVHDQYDVTHYDISLDLDIDNHIIYGEVEIQATAQEGDLSQVQLDLFTPMVVDELLVGGSPALYHHFGEVITVTLDAVYQIGEPFTIRCTYHGTPSYTGVPFRWTTHAGTPMICSYSEPYGAPAWWVCKDDPKDKATFAIHVTAPEELVTVSNGYLDGVIDNGDGTATYNWITDYPMSNYLFSIATTNFQSWSEVYTALDGTTTMDVYYYVYPEDFADAQVSFSHNLDMMNFFAELFGEYPFLDEKYAIAEFQHPGAMEHQTATSYGYNWITGNWANDDVVCHELAHSWVGDLITMTEWSHAWCKEGFATHCEALYFENRYSEAYYHYYMNGMNVLNYAHKQLYDINPPLDGAIYYKGAWVLHMLRHVVGDENFFATLKDYVADPELRYGTGDTHDLREAFEDRSGMDLVWFFDQWIFAPGYPRYSNTWHAVESGDGFDLRLMINQGQVAEYPIFKMPIDIAVTTDLGEERFVVWDSLPSQMFTLHTAGEPLAVALDPDGWIIKVQDTTTDVALGASVTGLRTWNHPNPFNPSTTIGFTLPEYGRAQLRIYDTSGRQVRRLFDAVTEAGDYEVVWDGRDDQGRHLPSGVYFNRLDTDRNSIKGQMVLLK